MAGANEERPREGMERMRAMLVDFGASPGGGSDWEPLHDTVMGGRSRGASRLERDRLVFEGRLETEDGGFVSIRSPVTRWPLEGAHALIPRVRGDGRTYELSLLTGLQGPRGRISYRAPVPTGPDWSEVELPLAGFVPRSRGDVVDGPVLDPAAVRRIGWLLADGRSGRFRLEVDRILVVAGSRPGPRHCSDGDDLRS